MRTNRQFLLQVQPERLVCQSSARRVTLAKTGCPSSAPVAETQKLLLALFWSERQQQPACVNLKMVKFSISFCLAARKVRPDPLEKVFAAKRENLVKVLKAHKVSPAPA